VFSGFVPTNALVVTELSKFIDWPETGFEEINGDVLEADFWPGITSELPVTLPRSVIERPQSHLWGEPPMLLLLCCCVFERK